ncbi:MAG: ABC transporter ATP-binding protein [Desulfobacterales bacterium]|nr:ABC transporter ATP-binding protein [Desulfobacterales bacterium]
MLKISKLDAYYDKIQALKGISIDIQKGKIISIIGTNGAGKSTLLKAISGLIRSKNGQILYQGKNISTLSPDKIVGLGISQVPEGRQIFIHLSVKDNIHLGAFLYYKRRNKEEIKKRIKDIYEIFPVLEKRSQQIAGTLSGGEQQMLAIARALMGRPELLLLDEPSMGIAPIVVKEILTVIKNLNKLGTTILLVEQNARAALEIANHSYVLENGEIVLEGLAQELIDNPKVKKAYLGG